MTYRGRRALDFGEVKAFLCQNASRLPVYSKAGSAPMPRWQGAASPSFTSNRANRTFARATMPGHFARTGRERENFALGGLLLGHFSQAGRVLVQHARAGPLL